jgi:hypothetical protein
MNDARRLLEGQAMYRDFFQFTTPGAQVVYWGLFRVFGVRAWIEDAVMLALAVALIWLTYEISTRVHTGWTALLSPVLLAGVTFRYYRDATHHWFSAVTISAGVLVMLVRRTTARLIVSGALCGLTLFTSQNKGAGMLLGICAFMFYENWPEWRVGTRRVFVFVTSAVSVFASCMMPFLLRSGWRVVLEDIVVFPLNHYSGVYANSWASFMTDWPEGATRRVAFVLTYAAVPMAFIAAGLRVLRNRAMSDSDSRVGLIAFVGAGVFLSVLPAAGGYRVASISSLGFVAGVMLLEGAGLYRRVALTSAALFAAAGILIPVHIPVRAMQLPIGRVAVPVSRVGESVLWASQNTSNGEAFVGNPILGFAMQYKLPNAVLYPSAGRYTPSEQYDELIAWSELNRPRYIVLHPSAFLSIYPTQSVTTASAFKKYLETEYKSERYLGDEEVFCRRGQSPRTQVVSTRSENQNR